MKTQKNHPESFEEIVFKNRNKAYGAFLLRKSYARTVTVAVTVTLLVFSFLVSWAMWNVKARGIVNVPPGTIINDTIRVISLDPPPVLPAPPELPSTAPRLLQPVVVDSAEDEGMVAQVDLNSNPNGPVTDVTGPFKADSAIVPPDPVTVPEPETPVTIVKEMPEFPGGDAERVKYLINNLTYPREAKEADISGTVYLEFIVERDGSISNIKILRGIGGGCDEEAVRVVQMMPKWKPGRQQGHEVRVRFNLPIKFTLH